MPIRISKPIPSSILQSQWTKYPASQIYILTTYLSGQVHRAPAASHSAQSGPHTFCLPKVKTGCFLCAIKNIWIKGEAQWSNQRREVIRKQVGHTSSKWLILLQEIGQLQALSTLSNLSEMLKDVVLGETEILFTKCQWPWWYSGVILFPFCPFCLSSLLWCAHLQA